MKRNIILLNLIITVMVFVTSCSTSKRGLLQIKDQGSFAVGGTIIKNDGTYNNLKEHRKGKLFTATMHTLLTKYQIRQKNCHWYSGMVSGNFQKHG